MICLHCQEAIVSRPRGLCWRCFYTPLVRERYPSTSKFGRRGIGNFNCRAPPLALPTQARPGTSDKVAVLAERASMGQDLWHPDDAPLQPLEIGLQEAA
jgi:hypothetical protein